MPDTPARKSSQQAGHTSPEDDVVFSNMAEKSHVSMEVFAFNSRLMNVPIVPHKLLAHSGNAE